MNKIESIKKQKSSWWLWFSVLETEDSYVLLFSSLLRSTENYQPSIINDNGGFDIDLGKVTYCSKIISDEALNEFIENIRVSNTLDFELLDESLKYQFAISDSRGIIAKTFGRSVVPVWSYYTTPDLSLWDNNLNDLAKTLTMLKNELGLPFECDYSRKFGNFEIHDVSIAVDSMINVVICNSRNNRTGGQQAFVRVIREKTLLDRHLQIHVICREKKDVVLNRLVKLEAGERVVDIEGLNEDSYELECWVFDDTGELIFQCHQHYCSTIVLNMGMNGRQVNLQDDLSKRAQSKDESLGKRIANVTSVNTQRSEIGGRSGGYERFNDQMIQIQSDLFTSQGSDKWFGKSVESEVEVIEHFLELISRGRAKKAIIVDPFFGADAFIRFVARVTESTLELVVLTSLSGINPDTRETLDRASTVNYLEALIEKVKDIVNCNLRVVNLNKGSSKQAFHDRYLVVYPLNELPVVYLLSNSINKMSGNWPFSMSKLEPAIARHAREYIEQLCEGKDNTRSGDLNITYEWPEKNESTN